MDSQSPLLSRVAALYADLLREREAAESREPVSPTVAPEHLLDALPLEVPELGLPFDEIAGRLRAIVEATPSTATRRFFNQLFGGREPFAVLGDALASALNNSMYTYKVAGPQVLVESELIERMGRLLGYEGHEGTFTPGGSISNLCAMLMARDQAVPEIRETGANGRVLRVYSSKDSHYSVAKAAAVLGIGRKNVVKVAVDDRGRMRSDELERLIDADLAAGYLPLMVNATAGTTVLGAFDPLGELAEICERRGLWLHIDGAFGGSMVLDERYAEVFAAAGRADSFTWDAHKLMGVPLSCSVILVRERGLLAESFDEAAGYLFQTEEDRWNPGTRSIQCGRRNDALKLWTNWLHHGTSGYRARTARLRNLALLAAGCVEADPEMTLVKKPESLTVCFTVEGIEAEVLCDLLLERHLAMVGHADVEGESVVRMAIVDPKIPEGEVVGFFKDVRCLVDQYVALEGRGALAGDS